MYENSHVTNKRAEDTVIGMILFLKQCYPQQAPASLVVEQSHLQPEMNENNGFKVITLKQSYPYIILKIKIFYKDTCND